MLTLSEVQNSDREAGAVPEVNQRENKIQGMEKLQTGSLQSIMGV